MAKTVWGKWTIDTDAGTLDIPMGPSGQPYQIRLEECGTAAQQLNWIYQLAEKTWMTDSDLGSLVQAFRDIFGRGVTSKDLDAKAVVNANYQNSKGEPVFG